MEEQKLTCEKGRGKERVFQRENSVCNVHKVRHLGKGRKSGQGKWKRQKDCHSCQGQRDVSLDQESGSKDSSEDEKKK